MDAIPKQLGNPTVVEPHVIARPAPKFSFKQGQQVTRLRSDIFRSYVTDNPSVKKFVSLLNSVDNGDTGLLHELNDEMEAKDKRLQGIANTRRMAVTALDWQIQPAQSGDEKAADEAAAFIREELEGMREKFHNTLVHLSRAISTNIAVTELVWDRMRLVKTNDVPGKRLSMEMGKVFIETDANITSGIPTPPGKYIVYTPNPMAGFPTTITITRALAWTYIIKHFSISDWSAFTEIFGMPMRIAEIPPDVEEGVMEEVNKLLRDMGSDSHATMPEGVKVSFPEVSRGTQPYESLVAWIEKNESILYLGQTLTTETTGVGSFALGKVHDTVRTDILVSDLTNEKMMVQGQLIAPMIAFRFPDREMPLPIFERVLVKSRDVASDQLTLAQIQFAKEMGLKIDEDWLYETLGIPKPIEEEETKEVLPDRKVAPSFDREDSGNGRNLQPSFLDRIRSGGRLT